MRLNRKDLLGLKDLTPEEITLILDKAEALKPIAESPVKKATHLRGKAFVTLFYENSTRTAKSFELAGKYLGGDVINVTASSSSVKKGETLKDTAQNLEAMGIDGVVIRHAQGGAPAILAKYLQHASVINAGDGFNEHPTQGLLDMLTIRQNKGSFKGLKVAILGDSKHSRVARSNIWGLTKMGAEVWLAGPSTLLAEGFEELGVKTTTRIEEALEGADVINTLRLQLERMDRGFFPTVAEYHKFWGLTPNRMKLAPKAIVMHPGPMNRGVEISSFVADAEQNVILPQVANGVAVRMAVTTLLFGGEA